MLGAWARFVHRHRGSVLTFVSLAVVGALFGVSRGAQYNSNNSIDTEASRASQLIQRELPQGTPAFVLVASSPTLTVDDPRFHSALQSALAPLATDATVTAVTTPYGTGGSIDPQRASTDRHHALTTIGLVSSGNHIYQSVRSKLTSPTLALTATGSPVVNTDYDSITNADASRGESLSIPLSLILLLLVFGSVVAATLPLAIALVATFGGLAVDRDLHVLDGEGRPIPGLFAAGEALGISATSGDSFCGGMLATPALSFGRILGRELALAARAEAASVAG